MLDGRQPGPNPFIGPRAYSVGETLYGRDREIQRLLHLLIAERIVVLYSPSGAGKTSLLQAGLVPRLREEDFGVLPIVRVGLEPTDSTLEGYPKPNRYVLSTLLSLEEAQPVEDRLPLSDLAHLDLASYLRLRTPRGPDTPAEWVLLFDQFEEVLTLDPTDTPAKSEFFAQVGTGLRERHYWAVFALREDYLAGLDPYVRQIPTRLHAGFRLDLLSAEAARQAVQRPARLAGIEFVDDAAERLIDDLCRVHVQQVDGSTLEQAGGFVEPVQLQVVCRRLWDRLPPDTPRIDIADIQSVGDVDQALANYYAEQVAFVADQTGVFERAIREWVDTQLITPAGIRGQVLQEVELSAGLPNPAIRALVDAHLVRAEQRRGFTWFELAHDRLVGPIRTDNAAWVQVHLGELSRRAPLWDQRGRPAGLLLEGPDLVEAEQWAAVPAHELTPLEAEFLAASRAARAAATRERRRNRLIRGLAVGASLLALVSLAAAGVAYGYWQQALHATMSALEARDEADKATADAVVARDEAQTQAAEAQRQTQKALQQQQIATARALAGQARIRATGQLDLALLLSVQASSLAPGVEANSSSLGVLEGASPNLVAFLHGHVNAVTSVAFSPNGTYVASGSEDRSIMLWDATTHQGRALQGHTEIVWSVAFSPDGKQLASASEDRSVRLWDVETGQAIEPPLMGHAAGVWSVAFSPVGRLLASGSSDGQILEWSPDTGQQVGEFSSHNSGHVYGLAFSPDGGQLTAATDGGVDLWDASGSGDPAHLPIRQARSVTYSPDGTYIAVGSQDDNGNGVISLWDTDTRKQLWGPPEQRMPTPPEHGAETGLTFSPDGSALASAGADGSITLWNIYLDCNDPLLSPRRALTGHTAGVTGVAFSPDGTTLASASADQTVRLWDRDPIHTVGQPFPPSLPVAPQVVRRLRLASGEAVPCLEPVVGVPVGGVSVEPDPRTIHRWDVVTRQSLDALRAGHPEVGFSLAFSSEGNRLATGTRTGGPILLQVPGGQVVGRFGTGASVRNVAFSPNGQLLAAGHPGGTVDFWNPQTGASLGQPLKIHNGDVLSLAFSSDGKYLASAGSDGKVVLWDTDTRQPTGDPLQAQPPAVVSLAFNPDGTLLASGGDDLKIHLWDVASRTEVGPPLAGHVGFINSLAFSPDGKLLASASDDRSIMLWDVASGTRLTSPLEGHAGHVVSLTFSPDSAWLVSGSADGTVILWDPSTGQQVGQLGPPPGQPTIPVTSVAFSPDGATLAVSRDGANYVAVSVWDMSADSWRQRACHIANRNLSWDEWQHFVGPAFPYQSTCPGLPPGEAMPDQ